MKLWRYFSVHLQVDKVPKEIKTIRCTQFLAVHETIDQLCGIDESSVNGINEVVLSPSMPPLTSIFEHEVLFYNLKDCSRNFKSI